MNIERTLRKAARNSGMSIKAMADKMPTPYGSLYRFIKRDDCTLTLPTADKLAKLLGFELQKKGR